MIFAIIVLGLALAVSLAFNLGLVGGKAPASSGALSGSTPSARADSGRDDDRPRKLESELEKKKKELDELKKAQGELKDELKAAKKKLFDQKEAEKTGDDLAKARADVERQASVQLENTRHELATALSEVQRLKAELEGKGKRRAEPAPDKREDRKDEPRPEKPAEVVTRVIRELSDVEKERIAKLEAQSSSDRKRANELERELRSLKGKQERMHRESKRVYSEANLARDKFRAVETRLNRTLLENDLLKRAIAAIEKQTGLHAEHTAPTAEELAESDRQMKEKFAAEDQAEAEARARLEAAPVASDEPAPEAAPAPAAEAAPAPEAAAAAPAPATPPTA